jgi:hypothetical protein
MMHSHHLFSSPRCCRPECRAAQSPIARSLADAIARGFANSHRLAEGARPRGGRQAAEPTADLRDKPTFNANAGYTETNHV